MNRTDSNISASSAAIAKAAEPGRVQEHQPQHPETADHAPWIKTNQPTIPAQVAGIAHDFNNLLTAVMWHGETMLFALPEGHPLRSNAEEICRAAAHGAQLAEALFALAQLEDGPKPA